MRAISDIGGYSTVFLPGNSPCFIMKNAMTSPKVLGLKGKAVRGMSGFHTGGCEKGWVYIDIEVILALISILVYKYRV